MKTLVVISNQNENSVSKQMLDEFIKGHKEVSDSQIDILDLYTEDIDFLNTKEIGKIFGGEENVAKKYANQFTSYDKIVFVYPFWNFNFPAIVKAYIDYVCYAGVTFKYTDDGPVGLLDDTKITSIVAAGGFYGEMPSYRYDVGYLSHIAHFLGGEYIEGVRCEGTNMPGHAERVLAEAKQESYELGKSF